jgi:hypothetical protein
VLDEDVAIEGRFGIESEARRASQQRLRLFGSEVGEE